MIFFSLIPGPFHFKLCISDEVEKRVCISGFALAVESSVNCDTGLLFFTTFELDSECVGCCIFVQLLLYPVTCRQCQHLTHITVLKADVDCFFDHYMQAISECILSVYNII